MSIRYVLPVLVLVCLLATLIMLNTNRAESPAEKSIKQPDAVIKSDKIPIRVEHQDDSFAPVLNQHVFLRQDEPADSPQTSRTPKPDVGQSKYSPEMEKTAAIVSQLRPGGLTTGSYQAVSIPVGKQGYTLHINNDRVTTIYFSDSTIKQDSLTKK